MILLCQQSPHIMNILRHTLYSVLSRPRRIGFEVQTMHSFFSSFSSCKSCKLSRVSPQLSNGGGGLNTWYVVYFLASNSLINNGCYFNVFLLLLFLENVRGDQLKNRLIPLDVI